MATVPAGSPSRGGDVAVSVFDINQRSLPTPFHSVLGSVFVFMTLSTVFHSINSPDSPSCAQSFCQPYEDPMPPRLFQSSSVQLDDG